MPSPMLKGATLARAGRVVDGQFRDDSRSVHRQRGVAQYPAWSVGDGYGFAAGGGGLCVGLWSVPDQRRAPGRSVRPATAVYGRDGAVHAGVGLMRVGGDAVAAYCRARLARRGRGRVDAAGAGVDQGVVRGRGAQARVRGDGRGPGGGGDGVAIAGRRADHDECVRPGVAAGVPDQCACGYRGVAGGAASLARVARADCDEGGYAGRAARRRRAGLDPGAGDGGARARLAVVVAGRAGAGVAGAGVFRSL